MSTYRVPFINYTKAYHKYKAEIDDALLECFEKGNLVYRDEQKEFESKFAKFCGVGNAIGTGSCTGAMFLSLKALGIGQGDEVITVSHTYVATIDVIVAAGATPVLVDVEWNSMNMDPSKIERAITTQTKAIMPVHLNGRMCDMEKIMEIAAKYNLHVIEDAAQAVGAHFDGHRAGSIGITGCFSFYPAKILGWFGEGGAVVTDDDKLASLLYCLRDHGEWPPYLEGGKKGEIYGWGFNSILDNIACAVLNVKRKHLPASVSRRRTIANLYHEKLSNVHLLLPFKPEIAGKFYDSFQNFVIRVSSTERDPLQQHLSGCGIETMVHWRTPNHKQKGLGSLNGYELPITEEISRRSISLPMYPELSDGQVSYVSKCIRSYFK
jgi:dTDP-4-amino-4,6-dideoxygalactose transaminase